MKVQGGEVVASDGDPQEINAKIKDITNRFQQDIASIYKHTEGTLSPRSVTATPQGFTQQSHISSRST